MFITALSAIATLWNQANCSSTNREYQAIQNKPDSENITFFLYVESRWEIKIQERYPSIWEEQGDQQGMEDMIGQWKGVNIVKCFTCMYEKSHNEMYQLYNTC